MESNWDFIGRLVREPKEKVAKTNQTPGLHNNALKSQNIKTKNMENTRGKRQVQKYN